MAFILTICLLCVKYKVDDWILNFLKLLKVVFWMKKYFFILHMKTEQQMSWADFYFHVAEMWMNRFLVVLFYILYFKAYSITKIEIQSNGVYLYTKIMQFSKNSMELLKLAV